MSTRIHYLNVLEGDCSIIEHASGHVTVIDVCNGNASEEVESVVAKESFAKKAANYHMKEHPTDPIAYLEEIGVKDIFRMIVTHPDMDHMDGLERLFKTFTIENFWTTENDKCDPDKEKMGRYNFEDWQCYKTMRNSEKSPKALEKRSSEVGDYWTQDGITILTPTKELIEKANNSKKYNISSYSFLYTTSCGRKILFGGDTEKDAWDYILVTFKKLVSNVDVLIAPHHGRESGGNDDYLDILKPKLTLFGNANSEHLDYKSWNDRKLLHITNNEAGNIRIEEDSGAKLWIYLENEKFAKTYKNFFPTPLRNMFSIGCI